MASRFLWRSWLVLGPLALLLAQAGTPTRADDEGAKVYQKVLKSVVWIHSTRGPGKLATGSGSLIDRKHRLILTNFHVVGDNNRATVLFPAQQKGKLVAEREYYIERIKSSGIRGRVIARDQKRDLAIIQIEEVPEGAEALSLAPGSVSPGQTVHSIGNPGGSGALWVYTPGKVRQVYFKKWRSELDGKAATFEADVVETDSATNPGDSGGPLVNDKAQLVGVTQGLATNARLLSTFIDVAEVKLFLTTREVKAVIGSDALVPPRPATALIKDDGAFFTAEAVKKATEEIRDIARKYERDVIVETHARVPADDRDKVKNMNREERGKYFRDWAVQRVRSEAVNGVLILICKEPSHLEVFVSQRASTAFDTKALVEILLSHFRKKEYDEGLFSAIKQVREKLSGGER